RRSGADGVAHHADHAAAAWRAPRARRCEGPRAALDSASRPYPTGPDCPPDPGATRPSETHMRTRLVSLALFLLLIAASLPASAHHTSADTPGATTVGKAADSKWTDTTIKAAANEANKKVLASGKPATVTGEVVEVSCYLQLGKRGEAHIPCGTKCI